MGFGKKKPTTLEVLNAIFEQVFTPEEIEYMTYPKDDPEGEDDVGFKQDVLDLADVLKPRYSIEESVRLTRRYVSFYRRDLRYGRPFISMYLADEIFKDIKCK